MDQWRSHIPSNNLPKQFCEWSFEIGDRKSQQNELELIFELDGDILGYKMECVGAGISGGEPPGAHEIGGAPYRGGAPSSRVAWCLPLLQCFQCLKSSNILEKIILNLQGIWSTFIFRIFFIARKIQKTDG